MVEQIPKRARWIVAVAATLAATTAAMALGVGLLDSAVGATDTGARFLMRGTAALVGTLLVLGIAWPNRWSGWRRLLVLAIGVWPFAMFALFIMWRTGVADEQQANCDAGDAAECRTLALRRERRHRDDEALVLFRQACDLGDHRSCATLAARLEGTERDSEVDALLEAACDGEYPIACTTLARRVHVEDPDAGLRYLARACELDDASACAELSLRRQSALSEDQAPSLNDPLRPYSAR